MRRPGADRGVLWVAGWPLRSTLVMLIRLYRATLSGLLGGQCRFHPSCSAYAEEAIGEVGVIRGLPLSVWRVLRCSPLSAGGVDHPPGHEGRKAAHASAPESARAVEVFS
jgi:putative membrane protein insertion efficiency factor